jgi:uncharacterized protein YdiU (UPF0061 family)
LFSLKEDRQLIHMLTENLQLTETDMTIFRKLSEIKKQQTIEDAFELIKESFYKIEEVDKEDAWMYWFTQYLNRLWESLSDTDRKAAMNQVNPKYVLRNYMSQLAIETG